MFPASPKRNPRLLVVTYHFPPDGSVGGLRWAGLSKYLARRGWEVHVLTASPATDLEVVPGRHLHSCAPTQTLNDRYNDMARRVRAARQRDGSAAKPTPAVATDERQRAAIHPLSAIAWIRGHLSAALAFPDYGRGWIVPASRKATELLNAHQFDVVVSSGPPHSAHIAATLACWNNPKRLWLDMRDPWAAPADEPWAELGYMSGITRSLIRKLERFVFGRAQGVITNTSEFASDVRRRYADVPVFHVSNGVDVGRLPTPATKFDGMSIAYAGTLYLSRDLAPVVWAMHEFLKVHPEARSALKLRVAGSMNETLEARFKEAVAATNLEDLMEVRGRVSGDEAMDMMNRSHLGLVLAQDQPTQIPAKLYECVAMGVHTLVIAESTSAAAREARRIGAATLESSDVAGITQLIEQIWASGGERLTPNAPITYDDIAAQMDRVLAQESASEARAVAVRISDR